jgi:hypothetical protein
LFILLTASACDNFTFDVDRLRASVSVEEADGTGDEGRITHSSDDTLLLLLLLLSRSILRETINVVEYVICLKQRNIEFEWLFKKQRISCFPLN